MINTTHKIDDLALTLPITREGRRFAEEFAKQQPAEKAQQVKLNTLAVWVVNTYLNMMEIPTNLAASDSWNRVMRFCANVADLEVRSIGRLECRPMLKHQQTCFVPPETWVDRVGYVIVQIDESLEEARLVGFVPQVSHQELPLNQLQPLEALIDRLEKLKNLVDLTQWFAGIVEKGWQTVESLLSNPEIAPAYGFRNVEIPEKFALRQPEVPIRMARLIDLKVQNCYQPIMLIVELSPGFNQRTSIHLKLHPTGHQLHLPMGVQLKVLDESGEVFRQAQARESDSYIQLVFTGEPREEFSVVVSLNDASVRDNFII